MEKNDAALVLEVLTALEAGQSPRTIQSKTGIPKLITSRIRRLHQHAPTLMIRVATGEMSITSAFQKMKERQAQYARDTPSN